jgi:hypothetical protein
VKTHLIEPKIVIKNYSDRIVKTYELEFRKADSASIYFVRPNIELAPKGTDSVETETPSTFIYAGEKVTEAVSAGTWTVRLDVVIFEDGSALTLDPSKDGSAFTLHLSKDKNALTLHLSPISPPSVIGMNLFKEIPPLQKRDVEMLNAISGKIILGACWKEFQTQKGRYRIQQDCPPIKPVTPDK